MKLSLKRRDENSWRLIRRRIFRAQQSKTKRLAFRAGLPFGEKRRTTRIQAPFALNIANKYNRRSFCKFMDTLRASMLRDNDKVIISFETTEIITPPAMILLIAEIDRAKRLLGSRFEIQFSRVNDRTVKQLLVQIGFYDLCGMVPPKLNPHEFEENVRHWRYATGERANESTNDAFAAIEGLISDKLKGGMWRGVSEAVINSVQHAYAEPRGVPGPRMNHRRWWMFTQERDDKLTVVVCDLGIGIPRSLPLNWDENALASIVSLFSDQGKDVAALKASLELGRTSTEKSHRGKGLPQIWDAVRESEDPERTSIAIHSNRGRIGWSGKKDEEFSSEFSTSIYGTVIAWTVPLTHGDER